MTSAAATVPPSGLQGSEESRPYLTPVWTTALPGPAAGRPAHDGERTYVSLADGRLVAVSLGSGAIQWVVNAGALQGLAAGDGLVFVATPAAIEARASGDGSVQWRLAIDAAVSGGLTWERGWLLAVTNRGTALAVRARDGESIWETPAGSAASVPPTPAADRVYLALEDGRVQSRQLLTGELVWERQLGGAPAQILPLDDRLFVGARDHVFYCLAIKNGDVKWRWRAGGAIVGAPSVDKSSVYFISLDNVLRALNRRNGHQRWRQLLSTRPSGGPLPFGQDVLITAGVAAKVWAYHAKDGSLAGEIPTPAELAVQPSVALAGSPGQFMLIVVTMEGQLQGLCLAPLGHPVKGLPLYLPLPGVPGAPDSPVRTSAA